MDKIIQDSIELLEDAIGKLKNGNRYNTKLPYEAPFPKGAADHIRMIFEPISRLDATNDRDKAVDTLAYSSNYVSWMRNGCPKSQFEWIMNRYLSLFRIQERRIELQKMEEEFDLREVRRDESGTEPNGGGTLPQLQG